MAGRRESMKKNPEKWQDVEDVYVDLANEANDEMTSLGKAAEKVKELIKDDEKEEQIEKEMLEDLKEASKIFNSLEEDLEEVENLHSMMRDGATLQDLSEDQRKLLLGDIDELKEYMDALMTLIEEIEEDTQQLEQIVGHDEELISAVEELDGHIEEEFKDIEEKWSQVQNVAQGTLGLQR